MDCNEKTTIIRIGVMVGEHDCFDRASILTWWNTPALFQDRSRQIMRNWFRGSYNMIRVVHLSLLSPFVVFDYFDPQAFKLRKVTISKKSIRFPSPFSNFTINSILRIPAKMSFASKVLHRNVLHRSQKLSSETFNCK